MKLKRPEAVLFDLDGTLIDTAPEFISIALQLRKQVGLPPIPPQLIQENISDGVLTIIKTALEIHPDDPKSDGWVQKFLTAYCDKLGSKSKPYPGIEELIRDLFSNGILWGVVTNKREIFARPLLEKMSFKPPANVLVTPDHVQRPKPDPEPVLLACELLKCSPSKVVLVGDNCRDIISAKRAGCMTISAGYGYIKQGESTKEWLADIDVQSSNQLASIIIETLS